MSSYFIYKRLFEQLIQYLTQLQTMYEKKLEKNGFLMIGDKDSGKTTYMNCAYGTLKSTTIDGFSIVAKDDSDDMAFSQVFANIKTGKYPLPTDKRSLYEFNITYKGDVIHQFSWTDYNGGMLFKQSNKDAEQFTEDMKKTSGIMLFFDSQRLASHQLDHGMRRMIKIISQNLPSVENEYFINIILTKFDLISTKLQKNFDILTKDLSPLIDMVEGNENIHLFIIPTCCTKSKIVNCDNSLMLMMLGPLKCYTRNQRVIIQDKMREMRMWEIQAGPINSFLAFLNDEKSAAERAMECKKKADEMQMHLDFLISKINSLQQKLIDINYVGEYFDGSCT